MAYPDPAALPLIATAIGRAYLPHLTARQFSRLLRSLYAGRPRPPGAGTKTGRRARHGPPAPREARQRIDGLYAKRARRLLIRGVKR